MLEEVRCTGTPMFTHTFTPQVHNKVHTQARTEDSPLRGTACWSGFLRGVMQVLL